MPHKNRKQKESRHEDSHSLDIRSVEEMLMRAGQLARRKRSKQMIKEMIEDNG